jgi:large conductance mechanosensitive channel
MVDITGLRDMKPVGVATNFAKEFRDFLLKTNMLALALAVVIGAAVNKVVNSIVTDVLGGLVKALQGDAHGWDALNIKIWRIEFRFGALIPVLIEFVTVAAIVFIITKIFIRNAPTPPTKVCPACKEAILADATKCKFCLTEQPAVVPPPPPSPAEAPKPAA